MQTQYIADINIYIKTSSKLYLINSKGILRIHVASPILGERISAIILPQQRKQWLSVELNRWRSNIIHCYFKNNKNRTLIIIMLICMIVITKLFLV